MPESEVWWARVAAFLARAGVPVSAVWGFAEATLWFIVPDVVVGVSALLAPRRWWRVVLAAITASLMGGVFMFAVAAAYGDVARGAVAAVPGVSEEMILEVGADLDTEGGSALLRAPLSGVPYKVYAIEMGDRSWSLASFLGWSVPARALRILPVGAVAALTGSLLGSLVRRRLGLVLIVYTLGWVAIYIAYFRRVGI